jgi:16S rRNA (adenine1518-N6/adenine1519-N6)-dimethyltransferase
VALSSSPRRSLRHAPEGSGPARPRQADLLRKWGIRLDRRLGQHFLADPRVPDRIADCVARFNPQCVVEMASGAGALSFALLQRGWPVHALELDRRMIELMREEAAGRDFQIEECDLAREDFRRHVDGRRLVFAGNLPYQVTSPILFNLLPALHEPSVAGAVVMVQHEVAQRMVAGPGSRVYGILSVLLQAQLDLKREFVVRPGSFVPPPEVDSAVVTLRSRQNPVDLGEDGIALVRELFSERRKQIGGLLRRHRGLSLAQVEGMDDELGIAAAARPESLSVNDFHRLATWVRQLGDR